MRKFPADKDILTRTILSSVLVSGCSITTDVGNLTFSISPGRLRFVTVDSTSNAVIQELVFPGVSGVSPLYSDQTNRIRINKQLQVSQSTTPQLYSEINDFIEIGQVLTNPGLTIFAVANETVVANLNLPATLSDLQKSINPIRRSGFNFGPSATNDLRIYHTAGQFLVLMLKSIDNPTEPNFISAPATTYDDYIYIYKDGVGGWSIVPKSSIDPTKYDDGSGTLQTVGGQWSIQRVYSSLSGIAFVQYGQGLYTTLSDAIKGISTEPFNKFPPIDGAAFFGYIAMKGTVTNLSDSSLAIFIQPTTVNGENNTTIGY